MANLSIPHASGIYKITCTPTGKIYIGSSTDIAQRWNEHRSQIRRKIHPNARLQNAWDKYGESNFILEVVELVPPMLLLERENHWLSHLRPYERGIGFNIAQYAKYSTLGRKLSPEHRMKLSIAGKGRVGSMKGKTLSPETRAKISAALRGKEMPHRRKKQSPELVEKRIAPLRGRKRSPEAVEKGAAKVRGVSKSPEHREKLRLANLGKKQSPETIAKSALARTGLKQSAETKERRAEKRRKDYIVIDPNGKKFRIRGLAKFCRENDLDPSSLCAVAHGRKEHHKGYLCFFVEDYSCG